MPLTVLALNPSIDVEWRVDRVQWEEKNLIHSERRWAGGKGVNVARWLRHLGENPRLLLPLGGPTGRESEEDLRAEKLSAVVIPLREPTRANVIVSPDAGRQLRFNPLGPKLSRNEWNEVLKNVERILKQMCAEQGTARHSVRAAASLSDDSAHGVTRPASLLILSGSLPRGLPVTAYALLIRLARRLGVPTLLDCDGPPFSAAVGARPFLVKPNEHELAQWWGGKLPSKADLLQAAIQLSSRTGGWVMVSRGGQGALLVNRFASRAYAAKAPSLQPVNTVGAGDAMLAAAACQIQAQTPPVEWLRWGVAVGTAATLCPAGKLPTLSSIQRLLRRVQITEERMPAET